MVPRRAPGRHPAGPCLSGRTVTSRLRESRSMARGHHPLIAAVHEGGQPRWTPRRASVFLRRISAHAADLLGQRIGNPSLVAALLRSEWFQSLAPSTRAGVWRVLGGPLERRSEWLFLREFHT